MTQIMNPEIFNACDLARLLPSFLDIGHPRPVQMTNHEIINNFDPTFCPTLFQMRFPAQQRFADFRLEVLLDRSLPGTLMVAPSA